VLDLYGDDWQPYDINEYAFLQEPYEFTFKGDGALVEAVFQAVGFATLLGLDTPDDGSETRYSLQVAPPKMVLL
jgi:hypothetical protein